MVPGIDSRPAVALLDGRDLEQGFRALMAAFPTGVAIVTASSPDGAPRGMTCSALCSVTLSPPTILICLRNGSPTLAAIAGGRGFAVNLLHHEAAPVARLFASGAADRFDQVEWTCEPGMDGPQLIDVAHAAVHCRLARADEIGDHVVVYGEVNAVWRAASPGRPLLYGHHRYAAWPVNEGI